MKLFSISSRALCTCINKHKNVINARVIISDTNIHERGLSRGNEDMQLNVRCIGNLLGCDSFVGLQFSTKLFEGYQTAKMQGGIHITNSLKQVLTGCGTIIVLLVVMLNVPPL